MDISEGLAELNKLKDKSKYDAMLFTASVITKLLEAKNIRPVIVGGLSVEIYTQSEYTTRDIDFVSEGYHIIEDVLFSLKFKKEGRHFYREDIEIAIEVPDNELAGSKEKVVKVEIDEDKYVYVISVEDIILDRLRATVHWKSEEDAVWGYKLLAKNFDDVDHDYLLENTELVTERQELENWINSILKGSDKNKKE